MEYSQSVLEKTFTSADGMKQAFLKASKWVATNVISKDFGKNMTYKIEKLEKQSIPTVKLTLYVTMNEDKIRERHCTICKEMSSAFFINTKVDCNRCSLKAYEERLDDNMARLKAYVEENLKGAK